MLFPLIVNSYLIFRGLAGNFRTRKRVHIPRLATSHERRWTFVRVPRSEETITYFTASQAVAFIVIIHVNHHTTLYEQSISHDRLY
jgi:hypothetical protein